MTTNCLKVLREASNLLADGSRVKVVCRSGKAPGIYIGTVDSVDTTSGVIELNVGKDESKQDVKQVLCEDVVSIEIADTGMHNGFSPVQERSKIAAMAASAHS